MQTTVERIGKFVDLREIHEGANSYAFQARHKHLGQHRFLKLIYLPKGGTETILGEPQALLEALTGGGPNENIVRLLDAEVIRHQNDDYILLQLEWIDSPSLQSQIEQTPFPFGQQDAVRIGVGILTGVAQMHSRRLVHRDLKPGNILLVEGMKPKLTDFGSVAHIKAGASSVTASRHSDLYVPPEGWQVPTSYTFASDVYQVALVLYQLVNGPFPTDGRHYLTKTELRALKSAEKSYDVLDACEKCQAEKRCFAELTNREKLIEHALNPRPYFSKTLKRILQQATRAKLTDRLESATAFLNKLSQVSVPNWKPAEDRFEAVGWQKWDWRVYTVKRRKGDEVVIERSQLKANKYRRIATCVAITEAFQTVENIK
jgi:serine/threonine protein kinase